MKKHNFHMVENSPWPILVSFTVLFSALGGAIYMHFLNQGLTVLSISLTILIVMLNFWFCEVVREGTYLTTEKIMLSICFSLVLILEYKGFLRKNLIKAVAAIFLLFTFPVLLFYILSSVNIVIYFESFGVAKLAIALLLGLVVFLLNYIYSITDNKFCYLVMLYTSVLSFLNLKLELDVLSLKNQIIVLISFSLVYLINYVYLIKIKKHFSNFSKKFEKNIYFEFFEKHPILDFLNFFRTLTLGVLAYQFEKKGNLILESIRILGMAALIFCLFGAVQSSMFILILLITLKLQRKQYKNSIYYLRNYVNNIDKLTALSLKNNFSNNQVLNESVKLFLRKMSKFAELHHIAMNNPGRAMLATAIFGGGAAAEIWGQRDLRRTHYNWIKSTYDTHNNLRPGQTFQFPPDPNFSKGEGIAHTVGVISDKVFG